MPTNKRQQIVTALDTRLKTIRVTNGYESDLGSNVFEWRPTPLSDDECPALIYRDTNEPIVITIGEHEHNLEVEILIFASGADSPATIRKMIADVVKAVGVDLTFGELAEDTKVGAQDMATQQKELLIAAARLLFTIEYTTEPFNPYT